MAQVQLNNMYIIIGANNGSDKLWTPRPTKKNCDTCSIICKRYNCVYEIHVWGL